jgi:hypothetical protein
VVVSGRVEGAVDFGGGELAGPGGFIVKLDSEGNHIWSRVVTSIDPSGHHFWGVAADADGNTVLTGYVVGNVDFGDGTTTGAHSIVVAKYDAGGAPLWSRRIGNATERGLLYAYDIATDPAGNAIVTGTVRTPVDFGGGVLSPQGGADILLAKFDPDGNHMWSQLVGGTEDENGVAVAVTSNNRIAVTGNFLGTVTFGPRGDEYTSKGKSDAFVARFAPDGRNLDYLTRIIGGPEDEAGLDIAANSTGQIAVAGIVGTEAAELDIFVARLYGFGTGGTVYYGGPGTDRAFGVGIGDDRSITLAGMFEETVDLGGDALTSAGYEDIFLARLETIRPQIDINPGTCDNTFNITPFVKGNDDRSHGGGVLRIALLSNGVFDVHDVDISTVHAIGVPPMSYRYQDVGTPVSDFPPGVTYCERLRGEFCPGDEADGLDDLVLLFNKREVAESGGIWGFEDGMLYPLGFFGQLLDGQYFGVFDCLRIVKNGVKTPDEEPQLADGTGPAVELKGAAPNPFNPTTTISYALRDPARVRLSIFSVRGELIATLVNSEVSAGDHSVTWEAGGVPSGVYFYRLEAGNFTETRKLVILK